MATIEERANNLYNDFVYSVTCNNDICFHPQCDGKQEAINALIEQDRIARAEEREKCKRDAKESFCLIACKGQPHRSTCISLGTCKDYDEFCAMLHKIIDEGGNQ